MCLKERRRGPSSLGEKGTPYLGETGKENESTGFNKEKGKPVSLLQRGKRSKG